MNQSPGFSTRKDITNKRFGKLVVVGFSHTEQDGQTCWNCVCDCGNTSIVRGGVLRRGKTKSCGCYRAENASITHRKEHKIADEIKTKRCYSCELWLVLSRFSLENESWDKLSSICKTCIAKNRQQKPRNKKYFREWANNRYKTNVNFKIKSCIQARIRGAIKNNYKAHRTTELIGCSIDFLIEYLEFRFDKNMSWENYGKYWHVDHIKPCAKFDLSNTEQQLACFHYTNLRPLEAIENVTRRHREL